MFIIYQKYIGYLSPEYFPPVLSEISSVLGERVVSRGSLARSKAP
jgi:hypothetical protein